MGPGPGSQKRDERCQEQKKSTKNSGFCVISWNGVQGGASLRDCAPFLGWKSLRRHPKPVQPECRRDSHPSRRSNSNPPAAEIFSLKPDRTSRPGSLPFQPQASGLPAQETRQTKAATRSDAGFSKPAKVGGRSPDLGAAGPRGNLPNSRAARAADPWSRPEPTSEAGIKGTTF